MDLRPGALRYVLDQPSIDIATNVVDIAHHLPFAKIGELYLEIVKGGYHPSLAATMGICDRFFLLTVLLQRTDAAHPWIYERCREIEAKSEGYLDLWARGHYKSTVITFAGALQEILNDPEITIGIFSHTRPIAKGFLRQLKREFETNADLKTLYPDVLWSEPNKQAAKWSEDDGIIVKRRSNPKESTVEAWGLVDGQPTAKHFRLRIYDDVVTEDSVTTPEMVDKTTKMRQLSDNLAALNGREWNIGTRYSLADTYKSMLDDGVLTERRYPATHNGKLDGRPVLLTDERWTEIKRKQKRTVAAQMLLNPAGGTESSFEIEWLKTFEARPRTLNVYIMVDPSRGSTERSDRCAMAVIGVDSANNKFLLDGYCHRMPLSMRWSKMRDLRKYWKDQPGIQSVSVGYERYGQQSDDEYFAERMRIEKLNFEIVELAWPRQGRHSKQDRIERLEPDIRSGAFRVPFCVWIPGRGACTWSVNASGEVELKDLKGDTSLQKRMADEGEAFRNIKPLRRLDEDSNVYDLTLSLIEELTYIPFASHDDLADATSRIYDMDVLPPKLIAKGADSLYSEHFVDH